MPCMPADQPDGSSMNSGDLFTALVHPHFHQPVLGNPGTVDESGAIACASSGAISMLLTLRHLSTSSVRRPAAAKEEWWKRPVRSAGPSCCSSCGVAGGNGSSNRPDCWRRIRCRALAPPPPTRCSPVPRSTPAGGPLPFRSRQRCGRADGRGDGPSRCSPCECEPGCPGAPPAASSLARPYRSTLAS